jgi:predicted transcriptional regulator
MAKSRSSVRLGSGELEILEMLWREGPVTILEAQRALGRPIGYTTMQTRLNRLVEKKVVSRTKQRPGRYTAVVAPQEVSAGLLELLLQRVCGGSVVPLVAHLINGRRLSAEEIAALKQIISGSERENKEADR